MTTTKYPVRTFEYARITNVVDGDTCDIEVDLGYSVKVTHRFRLAEINAPEVGQPGAKEATAYLKQFVGMACILDVTKLDKYGRYLADISVEGVANINKHMLELGLAKPYV